MQGSICAVLTFVCLSGVLASLPLRKYTCPGTFTQKHSAQLLNSHFFFMDTLGSTMNGLLVGRSQN
jgi:hypothetical protein